MDFVKTHWRPIAFAAVCLLGVGAGVWGYLGGSEIEERLQSIERLRSAVEQQGRSPANARTIEAKEKDVAKANAEFEEAMTAALARQQFNAFESQVDESGKIVPAPRKPLVENALPQPASAAVAIEFKHAYERAFAGLVERLNGRGKPTNDEISEHAERLNQLRSGGDSGQKGAWGAGAGIEREEDDSKGDRSLAEVLRDYPRARITEEIAKKYWMYVDDFSIGKHEIARSEDAPTDVAIWQAQMSLWIQQDIVTALARCNEARAEELRKANRTGDIWVANMPVKRLIRLGIDNRLGKGGGSNGRGGFATSFTGQDNNDKMFVVPIAVELVVEEASMMRIVDELCRIGFYTPTAIKFNQVKPNPAQEDFIYGAAPAVEMQIDLEGYYFRKVYDKWIPKTLDRILKTAGAKEDTTGRGG